jgi:hypothetical protein
MRARSPVPWAAVVRPRGACPGPRVDDPDDSAAGYRANQQQLVRYEFRAEMDAFALRSAQLARGVLTAVARR